MVHLEHRVRFKAGENRSSAINSEPNGSNPPRPADGARLSDLRSTAQFWAVNQGGGSSPY